MPRSLMEVLDDAQKFYESKGYGKLPDPLTSESLANDKAFCDFYSKYEKAYHYYSESGYPESLIQSHLDGIDFNHPVDVVIIPAGQKHTQTQVAWGAKGNYYGTSDFSPQQMGISSQGKVFDPTFVPSHLKASQDQKIAQIRAKMLHNLEPHVDPEKFDEAFPPLPTMTQPKSAKILITDKRVRTYEAQEDVRALKSTAKEIVDTWSVPNKVTYCPGGGLQLYVNTVENEKMKQFELGIHDAPANVRFTSP